MWQCMYCREETADDVDVCWHCGMHREIAASRESQAEPDDPSAPDGKQERPDSDRADGDQATPALTHASMAVLLLRFLGLWITAYGAVGGVVAVGHLLLLLRRFGFDHGWGYQLEYLIRPGAELIIGLYLLLGGQWVYNRLLTPVRDQP